jgi:hypothetical protein
MEKNKNMTAVEWLVEQLLDGKLLMPSLIEQAKRMEKEQITDAFYEGDLYGTYNIPEQESYYDKIYGKK